MSAEIEGAADGILTVKITGTLTQPELAHAQKRAAEIFQQRGRMRILVLTDGFRGWAQGGDWGDISFQLENDPFIEKIAIVGERKWEELAVIFVGKGLRESPVEFFQSADLAKARAWLTAAP
jgi:hypothetical protein